MRRRSGLGWILALLFLVVPILEIYLIIQLGEAVGPWWTILILVADAVLGAWLVRHEGARAWLGLQEALSSGRMPAKELADGALILVGGTLLVTPGFISDAVGLFCILPFSRPVARRVLAGVISRRLSVVQVRTPGQRGTGTTRPGPGAPQGRPDVVTGEVVDDGPEDR